MYSPLIDCIADLTADYSMEKAPSDLYGQTNQAQLFCFLGGDKFQDTSMACPLQERNYAVSMQLYVTCNWSPSTFI